MQDTLLNIFESPWLIIIIAAVVWVVITLIALLKGLERKLWRLLLPLLIALVAFPIDHFIKTDYEKVDIAVSTITSSAVNMTPELVEPIISENYSDAAHRSKKQLLTFCQREFSRPNIKKINEKYYKITINRSTATCEMDLVIILNPKSRYAVYANILTVEMKMNFNKTPDGQWLLTSSEISKVNNQPASWKNAP